MNHVIVERAWAAGFFDGEGYVGRNSAGGRKPIPATRKRLTCSIAQTDRFVLDRFQSIVKVGKVRGPYQHKNRTHTPYYQWTANNKGETEVVFEILGSFLSPIKFSQFVTAIEVNK